MIKQNKNLICPISRSKKFYNLITLKKFPIYMGVVEKNYKPEFLDLNFNINKITGTVQIYPRVPLKKLYFKSHGSGTIGKLWQDHHNQFYKFIKKKINNNILEIGGGHNSISKALSKIKKNLNINLTSFDPNGKVLSNLNHKIIKDFFNPKNIKKYNINKKYNLIIHSHLIEHIYSPMDFLKNVHKLLDDDGYHIFSIPNLKNMIENGYANAMNFEHPYYFDESLLDYMLKYNGFKILKKKFFKTSHSIFYLTKKNKMNLIKKKYNFYVKNKKIFLNLKKKWDNDVELLNNKIHKKKNIFLFGAHIFSQNLIFNGLNISNIKYILDNDPNKVNKYCYGTSMVVKKPSILKKYPKPIVILRAGPYNSEIRKKIINSINKRTKFI